MLSGVRLVSRRIALAIAGHHSLPLADPACFVRICGLLRDALRGRATRLRSHNLQMPSDIHYRYKTVSRPDNNDELILVPLFMANCVQLDAQTDPAFRAQSLEGQFKKPERFKICRDQRNLVTMKRPEQRSSFKILCELIQLFNLFKTMSI